MSQLVVQREKRVEGGKISFSNELQIDIQFSSFPKRNQPALNAWDSSAKIVASALCSVSFRILTWQIEWLNNLFYVGNIQTIANVLVTFFSALANFLLLLTLARPAIYSLSQNIVYSFYFHAHWASLEGRIK